MTGKQLVGFGFSDSISWGRRSGLPVDRAQERPSTAQPLDFGTKIRSALGLRVGLYALAFLSAAFLSVSVGFSVIALLADSHCEVYYCSEY